MQTQRARLISGGRLQVPANLRRQLGLVDGDQVIMRVVDGELHIRPARAALERIHAMLRPYARAGELVSDELIADRREQSLND